MSIFNKLFTRGETVGTEAEEQAARQAADTALGNAGFVEFLDYHNIDLRDASPAEIAARFETYKKAKEAAKDLQEMFSKEVEADTGGEIKLSPVVTSAIEAYVLEKAATDPSVIEGMTVTIKEFKDLKQQIAKEEKKIEDAKTDLKSSQFRAATKENTFKKEQVSLRSFDKKHTSSKPLYRHGKFIYRYGKSLIRDLNHDSLVNLKKTRSEQAKIQRRIENTGHLEELQTQLGQLKAQVFRNSELGQMVNDEVTKDTQWYFGMMADYAEEADPAKVKQSLEVLEKLEDLDQDPDSGAMDYLKAMKSTRGEYSHSAIKDRLSAELGRKIKDTIENEFIRGIPTLRQVMDKLTLFMKKNKPGEGNNQGNERLLKLMTELMDEGRVEAWPAGKRTVFARILRDLETTNQ